MNIYEGKRIVYYFSMNMRKEAAAKLCPSVEAAFGLLGKKWTGLIIHSLLEKDRYFCELEEAIPALSARVLTLRMRELECEGLVTRSVTAHSPVRVSYALTPKGRALGPVLDGIAEWAYAWIGAAGSGDAAAGSAEAAAGSAGAAEA
jgi:DNA-binding HxlR family transcriptional regulator